MAEILQKLLDLNPGDFFDPNSQEDQEEIPTLEHPLDNSYNNPVVPEGCEFVQSIGTIFYRGIPIARVHTIHISKNR